ncbi:hypothetical protein AAZX31_11G012300 [Glycine max]
MKFSKNTREMEPTQKKTCSRKTTETHTFGHICVYDAN